MNRYMTMGLVCVVLLSGAIATANDELHEWVSTNGYRTKASFVGSEIHPKTKGIILILKKENGKIIRVPADRLDSESQRLAIKKMVRGHKPETTTKTPKETSGSQKWTPAQLKAAKEFGHGKVNFKTTLPQFRRLYPRAIKGGKEFSGSSVGVTVYVVREDAFSVLFCFLDRELYKISFDYDLHEAYAFGGADALLRRTKTRFGEPNRPVQILREGYVYRDWVMKDIDRMVQFCDAKSDGVQVGVVVISRCAEVEKRKAKRNAGF